MAIIKAKEILKINGENQQRMLAYFQNSSQQRDCPI